VDPEPLPWTDCHVHLVNFLQEPADAAAMAAELLRAGCRRAVVFGLPVKKKWSVAEPLRPGYYLDGSDPCVYHSGTDTLVRELVPGLEGAGVQVAPLACGADPTDQLAHEVLGRTLDSWDRWAGVGEVLLRHDTLTNLTVGETPRADHRAMVLLLEECAARGVPVSVHHDTGSPGRPAAHEYVPQLRWLLRQVPGATVVWCHAGSSRGLEPHDQLDLVEEVMLAHPGVVLELSWVLLDQLARRRDDGVPVVDGRWCDLVVRHGDRVVLGSDALADPSSVRERAGQVQALLEALPDDVRAEVAEGTAARLWFGGQLP
jgi:predicted TIM-barrel fold metal-dependent hydrolase